MYPFQTLVVWSPLRTSPNERRVPHACTVPYQQLLNIAQLNVLYFLYELLP